MILKGQIKVIQFRVPTGSGKQGKQGKKIMVREKSGKSQGILFWAKSQGKVGEFCFKLPIAMKIYCYSCRLSRMFVTVFINMKVYM